MKTHPFTLRHLALTFVFRFTLGTSFVIAQGSLTPPGAPAPTMKTLDQVEPRTPISALPFTISTPGSYFITGNLTGVAGQHGTTINADNVTLDLGGFELVGPGSGVTAGIRLINTHINATIRNGTVRNWLSSGGVAETTTCQELQVENVRVYGSGGTGIALGDRGTARGCVVRSNTAHGISGGANCKVIDCTASSTVSGDGINLGNFAVVVNCHASFNGNDGIQTGLSGNVSGCVAEENTANGFNASDGGNVLRDCTAFSNGTNGIFATALATVFNCNSRVNAARGFSIGTGSTVTGCATSDNGTEGFSASAGTTVAGCTAFSNTGPGIFVGDGGSVIDSAASQNATTPGIGAGNGCSVIHCTANANTSAAAASAGISVGAGCTVSGCAVSSSTTTNATPTSLTGMGINALSGCLIERCTVRQCKGDGTRVTASCEVVGNMCDSNGDATGSGDGAGIHATGNGNTIASNKVTLNDRGIDVDGTRNVIVKNTARTNTTNYDIVANNLYGPIIDLTAVATAAATGNSAASVLTSTDPTANYAH